MSEKKVLKMNEKKVLKMNDDTMKNVTGGQGPACEEASSGYDNSFDINVNYEHSNTVIYQSKNEDETKI